MHRLYLRCVSNRCRNHNRRKSFLKNKMGKEIFVFKQQIDTTKYHINSKTAFNWNGIRFKTLAFSLFAIVFTFMIPLIFLKIKKPISADKFNEAALSNIKAVIPLAKPAVSNWATCKCLFWAWAARGRASAIWFWCFSSPRASHC